MRAVEITFRILSTLVIMGALTGCAFFLIKGMINNNNKKDFMKIPILMVVVILMYFLQFHFLFQRPN